jgi:3',5'-cyclic-nucleotide phosphodiesterase
MINIRYVITLFFCVAVISAQAQHSFKLVPLGVLGGADESNLSAYMLAPQGSDNFICLDAGTLRAGIDKAVANKVFNVPAEHVLRQYIKGYFISHSHLDHVSGLILNSPDDSTKSIYGFADCLKTIETHYFTWTSWANFADAGEAPALKKYHYEVLTPGEEMPIRNTEMSVKAFPLSHSNLTSTAFLVKSQNSYVLYLGDTGPDAIEKSTNMHKLWEAIAPLIKSKSLKAIMIETSFPDEQPDKSLFGHFTPKWLMSEFAELETLTGAGSLKGFNVIITHLKLPQTNIVKIKQQLNVENKLQLHLIYPKQGEAIGL